MKYSKPATTSIYLDIRKTTKEGKHAVKLRVTHNRVQRYFPLGTYLTKEEFEKTQLKNARGLAKERQIHFHEVEANAHKVIKEIGNFSFQKFNSRFLQKEAGQKNVESVYKEIIHELEKEERLGTASAYNTSLNAIKKFATNGQKKKIYFDEINPEWLYAFEKWLLNIHKEDKTGKKKPKSISTVGIYLRALRAVINRAIYEGLMDREAYPFGKRKYQIPASRNIKKALTLEQIEAIYKFETTDKKMQRARDLWCLSYLFNGMNIKDLANLRWSNLQGEAIVYNRIKTGRSTRSNQTPIVVPLIPESKEILHRWCTKSIAPDDYIFPFLSKDDSPAKAREKVQNLTKAINLQMKHISKVLDLPFRITTYYARHSYATILKRSGASVAMISEALGHTTMKTTQTYLDSFEIDTKREFQQKLINF